jgi:hypothetical protein
MIKLPVLALTNVITVPVANATLALFGIVIVIGAVEVS